MINIFIALLHDSLNEKCINLNLNPDTINPNPNSKFWLKCLNDKFREFYFGIYLIFKNYTPWRHPLSLHIPPQDTTPTRNTHLVDTTTTTPICTLTTHTPQGDSKAGGTSPQYPLSPGGVFGTSRSLLLDHAHHPSSNPSDSSSQKRFPGISMFSKTKQIVKLPLRRTDQFHVMDESLVSDFSTEMPAHEEVAPIKIKVCLIKNRELWIWASRMEVCNNRTELNIIK